VKKIFVLISILILSAQAFALKIEGSNVVDDQGNKIALKEYSKIIVIDPAVVETIYMIGGEENIAAIANTMNQDIWPMEETKKIPSVGTLYKPSIEKIISYKPDLVVINPMISDFGKSLKERGITYLINNGNSFEEILDNVKIYGKLTGKGERSNLVAIEYKEKLEQVKKKLEKNPLGYKGVFLFSSSPMMAFNSKSLPGQVFKILGIENITDNLKGGRPIISPEYLISQNPDILLGAMGIKGKEDILNSNPFVMETTAGKKGNVAIVESSKILRPTPRIIDTVGDLYEELSNWK
jgi:ABC-type Fe3+-hydroxamate transport system substrate-binding protein